MFDHVVYIQSSHFNAFMMNFFVYIRTATKVVVPMAVPIADKTIYGCKVYGLKNSAGTPCGGVKAGFLYSAMAEE